MSHHTESSPGRERRHRERGALTLVAALLFVLVLSGAAVALQMVSRASASRSAAERDVAAAGAIADAGLAFVNEQWRAHPDTTTSTAFLYVTTLESDGWAEITTAHGPGHDSAHLGTWYTLGKGRFTLVGVQDNTIINGGGKTVRVLGQYDGASYTVEAVLCQNTSSPIEGVGTQSAQSWSGGSFSTIGNPSNNPGAVFSNSTITIAAGVNISGSVSSHGTTTNHGTVTGNVSSGAASIAFPNEQAIVNTALANAQAVTAPNWWNGTDPKSALANALAGQAAATRPYMEVAIASAVTGWGNANGKQAHLYVKGNGNATTASTQVLTLPGTGQYAFGRLWIDGATVVIQAPPNGGVLLMPDIFVENGGRLIIDTSLSSGSPPLQILNQGSNQWENTNVGNVYSYAASTDTWSTTAAASHSDMTNTSTAWTSSSGTSAKPSAGNGSYDEWQVSNSGILATITSSPQAEGAVFYNTAGTDFVMNNGGYIMGGVQAANATTLETGSFASASGLFSTGTNAAGWVGWSGGDMSSSSARFNVNAHGGSPAPSGYAGLTYGAYDGAMGNGGSLRGAFVGSTMSVATGASVAFDPNLLSLVQAAAANTNHVMAKRRIPDPAGSVLSQIP